MASSSNHNTTQETLLHASWRTAYIRLLAVGGNTEAAILTQEFASVLDVSYKDLVSCYWPPGPIGKEPEAAREEWKMHQAIAKFGWKLNEYGKVEQAANAVVEAGEMLVRCGRSVEGRRMGEMGGWISFPVITMGFVGS